TRGHHAGDAGDGDRGGGDGRDRARGLDLLARRLGGLALARLKLDGRTPGSAADLAAREATVGAEGGGHVAEQPLVRPGLAGDEAGQLAAGEDSVQPGDGVMADGIDA